MTRRLVSIALLMAAALPARAELWGYVDASGLAHFADHAVDSRYTPVLRARGGEGALRVPGKTMTGASLLTWLEYAPEVKLVQPLLREAEQATGVHAELLQALIAVESGYRADSVSPRGAIGLMQIMPASAGRYMTREEAAARTVDEHLREPRGNVLVGARMMADLSRRLGGIDRALAAWNAGEGAVRRSTARLPDIAETRSHVHLVLELYWALLQRRHFTAGAQPLRLAPAAITH
jgi:soluble lytic murein transglycosylase-like protein